MMFANSSKNGARLLFLVVFVIATFLKASAQTPWCTDAKRIEAPGILYPPIARAAHISGTVIGRLHLSPDGAVENFEPVAGPVMLSRSVANQVKSWKFQTGSQLRTACQNLLVVTFTIGDSESAQEDIGTPPPGILQISVRVEPIILYSTPTAVAAR
jgi:hypothetical protein